MRLNLKSIIWFIPFSLLIGGCSTKDNKVSQAENSINAIDMTVHVRTLASDDFQGRKPFTKGE